VRPDAGCLTSDRVAVCAKLIAQGVERFDDPSPSSEEVARGLAEITEGLVHPESKFVHFFGMLSRACPKLIKKGIFDCKVSPGIILTEGHRNALFVFATSHSYLAHSLARVDGSFVDEASNKTALECRDFASSRWALLDQHWPSDAPLRMHRGNVLIGEKRVGEALTEHQRAAELDIKRCYHALYTART